MTVRPQQTFCSPDTSFARFFLEFKSQFSDYAAYLFKTVKSENLYFQCNTIEANFYSLLILKLAPDLGLEY